MIVRRIVGWVGELLVTAGVLLLLFVAWQLWWTDVIANREQSSIVSAVEDDFAKGGTVGVPAAVDGDGVLGLLRIPRLGEGFVRPVIEGTGRAVLAKGIGHYADTVDPGKVGNFSLAGHRTTYGRPFHDIDTIRDGDRIVVETRTVFYVYEATGNQIVGRRDNKVIAPVPNRPGARPVQRLITLTSCHPKFSATQRYIVHGILVDAVPRAQWVPGRWLVT
jgi:sortase A